MEETVEAVEINEGTVISDVLDLTTAGIAWLDILEERTAFLHALLFDELAAGHDDVLAVEVDFDDLKVVGLANVLVEVLGRLHIDL